MSVPFTQALFQWLGQWDDLALEGRTSSAKASFDKALSMDGELALPPAERALLLYNTGVFYLDKLADGVRARSLLASTVDHFREHPEVESDPRVGNLLPFAYEDLMLLSLSFDEYDQWADELRRARPDEGILAGQVPVVHKQRDEGMPWSDTMRMIASGYYRRNDPAADKGLYGRAAGIYQLLLENRRSLRLNREEWSEVLYEYGALMQKLNMVATRAMEQSGNIDPAECRFFLEQARSRIDEFVAANTPNDAIKFLSESIDESLKVAAQPNRGQSAPYRGPSGPMYERPAFNREIPTPRQAAMSCLPPLVVALVISFLICKALHLF